MSAKPIPQAFLDAMISAVFVADLKGAIVATNLSAQKLFKTNTKTELPTTVEQLMSYVISIDEKPFKPKQFPYYLSLRQRELVGPAKIALSINCKLSNLVIAAGPVKDKDRMNYILIQIREISKEANERHWQKIFIKLIGHELKQPLGLIRAYSYSLRRFFKNLETEATESEFVTKIDHQVSIINQMFNDIVEATKVSFNNVELNTKTINVNTLLKELVEDLQVAYPNRKVQLVLPRNEVLLKVDPIRIHQAAQNLATNALKYSQAEKTVKISLQQTKKNIKIVISDKGLGISEEDMQKIFEPYFRSSSGTDQGLKGLGLGLWFVKNVMLRHGGTVEVKSDVGDGSTFALVFPLAA